MTPADARPATTTRDAAPMEPTVLPVLEVGTTFDTEGRALPTAVVDGANHPEVADLARVHAMEGIGDLTTDAMRMPTEHPDAGDVLLLGVRMTSPVLAMFVLVFDLEAHRPMLEHAGELGELVIAHTPPSAAGDDHPAWLSINLDGEALAAHLG